MSQGSIRHFKFKGVCIIFYNLASHYWTRWCSTIQKQIYFLLGFYYFNTKCRNHITLVKNVCTWIFKSVWTKCSRCSWHRLMCGILLHKGTVQKTDFDACGRWQKMNSMVFREHTCIATHLPVFSRGHLFGSEVVDHPAALQAVKEEKVPVRSISLRQRLPNTCKQIFRHVWRYRPWILSLMALIEHVFCCGEGDWWTRGSEEQRAICELQPVSSCREMARQPGFTPPPCGFKACPATASETTAFTPSPHTALIPTLTKTPPHPGPDDITL